MTEEDFLAWRESPVTRWFMRAFENSAKLAEQQWKERSWESGIADQESLSELRAKAVTFASVHDATFDDIQARQDEHFGN